MVAIVNGSDLTCTLTGERNSTARGRVLRHRRRGRHQPRDRGAWRGACVPALRCSLHAVRAGCSAGFAAALALLRAAHPKAERVRGHVTASMARRNYDVETAIGNLAQPPITHSEVPIHVEVGPALTRRRLATESATGQIMRTLGVVTRRSRVTLAHMCHARRTTVCRARVPLSRLAQVVSSRLHRRARGQAAPRWRG